MKITIIGAGSVAGLLGVLLTRAGEDVTLVARRDEVVDAVRKEGIRLDLSDGRTMQANVKITRDVHAAGVADIVMLAVKSYSTAGAVETARPLIGPDTWVLSVQNGAGNIETIARSLGDESHIIGGVFWSVVTPIKPNHLSWVVGTGGLRIGPANGVMSAKMDEIAGVIRKAGIDVMTSASVQDLIWNKVLQNVPLALATVLRITNDQFAAYPHTRDLIVSMAEECVKVASALGIALENPQDPVQPLLNTIQKFHDSGKKPKCSMLQDLERGRKTEIDAINGSIVREGKRLGIPTPVNDVMVMLVKAQEDINCAE